MGFKPWPLQKEMISPPPSSKSWWASLLSSLQLGQVFRADWIQHIHLSPAPGMEAVIRVCAQLASL